MPRARDFDAVILDQYAMVWAIGHIQRKREERRKTADRAIADNFKTRVAADIARDFRGNLFHKIASHANARKTANAEHGLVRGADKLVTLTAEDAKSFSLLSPLSAKFVVPPGYNGPRAPNRRIGQG